ncbi:hypothetical protein [Streptacidiphilus sp. P02-A3a]|uniref:hypothetical protein n=1 Tax=Streptacidiphilus sp. P02-A3a TaxID=2704468 RepID=UPI0015F87E59|nr:hypothetical protein [Streptacidiphilus sp. P02-A3a]QMU68263.1 hypothetical protein GXP74_08510 [Streptacidiphilus sp. P02-A3a]
MDDQGSPSHPAHPGGPRGVATGPAGELRERVLGSWDALLVLAADREDVGPLAELGSWPERPVLARLLAQARGEHLDAAPPRTDHSGAGREPILAALAEARHRVADALELAAARPALALAELDSTLGPLPLLTQVHAMGHELALAALRLPDGAEPALPAPLAEAGVAALVDVVGALAHRQGLRTRAAVWGRGTGGWQFRADPTGWTTTPCRQTPPPGVPGIEGPAATVLGVPSGRAALPALLARGDLRLHRIGGLMALAPLVEQVPGLPGGALLRRAVGVVGLLGRLPGVR